MFQFDTTSYISCEELLQVYRENWLPAHKTEEIPIEKARGRVAASTCFAQFTIPVLRSAKADAVAVRSADFVHGMPDSSNWIKNRDYALADMGDDFDDRFDALIMVEDAEISATSIRFPKPLNVEPGRLISQKGAMIAAGDPLLEKGRRISAFDQANLAMGGIKTVEVIAKPRVAFIPTGNELIPPGQKPERGQIIDTNSLMVRNFLEQWDAEAIVYPIVKDINQDLEAALKHARSESDIVLINGGSSKGQEDLCAKLLKEKASFFQHYVKAVPGRPAAFSLIDGQPCINIPGPVPATFCVLHWCVRALIAQYYGREQLAEHRLSAHMKNALELEGKVSVCLWFQVEKIDGEYYARAYTKEDKLNLLIHQANAFCMMPLESRGFNIGDTLELNWIDPLY